MIAPFRLYRRIVQIEERILALPPRLFVEAGFVDPMLDHLPDDERREVLRLIDEALDMHGQFRWHRLTPDQRMYIDERIHRTDAH